MLGPGVYKAFLQETPIRAYSIVGEFSWPPNLVEIPGNEIPRSNEVDFVIREPTPAEQAVANTITIFTQRFSNILAGSDPPGDLEQQLQGIADQHPENPVTNYLKARLLQHSPYQDGLYDAVVNFSLQENNPLGDSLIYQMALREREQKNLDRCIEACELLFQRFPNSAYCHDAFELLLKTYQKKRDSGKALQTLERYSTHFPNGHKAPKFRHELRLNTNQTP
jgi:outer membrane protein assembly factor BamD (BamD/ComL family)